MARVHRRARSELAAELKRGRSRARRAMAATCARYAPSRACRRSIATRYRITLKGELSAVRLLARDAVLRADALGGGPLLSRSAGMAEKNFTLDWWPVGTGPYMLTENNPNSRMVLERNPNFRGEPYPSEGEPGDAAAGLLADAGKPHAVHRPRRVHAREGKHSATGTSSCRATTTLRASARTSSTRRCTSRWQATAAARRRKWRSKGIRLDTSVATTVYYLGFNMIDPVVGGDIASARASCARRSRSRSTWRSTSRSSPTAAASSLSPLPPGIFGCREGEQGINPVTTSGATGSRAQADRSEAQSLLAEAGYPDGRDANTGQPLVLYFDTTARGPGDKSAPRLVAQPVREARHAARSPRVPTGTASRRRSARARSRSTASAGIADYPDPENFLFLLYGPEARADGAGENARNYRNREFDALFERMKNMPNSPERQRHHRPHGGDRAPRRAVDLRLPSEGLQPAPRLAAQRQAQQHGAATTSSTCARSGGCAPRCAREWNRPVFWPLLADPRAARRLRHSGVRVLSPARAHGGAAGLMLAYMLRRVLYAIPILIGVNLLTFALFFVVNTPDDMARMQLGVEARHARRRSRSGRRSTATTSRCSGTRRQPGCEKATRHHLLREIAAPVRLRLRRGGGRARYRATRSAAAWGRAWRSPCRCSLVGLAVNITFAHAAWPSSARPTSTSGAWCCAWR